MQKLSKFIFFLFFILTIPFFVGTSFINAQDKPDTDATNSYSDPKAYPGIKFPCDETNAPDPDFHSLRPYQGAPCGGANRALYCSNDIQFVETFNLTDKCPRNGNTSDFWCPVNYFVPPHTLFIELTGSMFPIMGNTEEVKNSQGGVEQYDDARKVNEYASWYLSGVNNRAEYGENTNERVVNYSGPVQKLLPKTIQEAQRIETIKSKDTVVLYIDDDGNPKEETSNHDQIVVCADEKFLGIFGKTEAKECYNEGGEQLRLSSWDGDLSELRERLNNNTSLLNIAIDGLLGGIVTSGLNSIGVDLQIDEAWNKRTPPLPWDDGTAEGDEEKVPFKSDLLYQKAYKEWQGKFCLILPIFGLTCIEDPTTTNKYADLYQYIPLSNTTDKRGANYILGDGPDIQPGNGTKLAGDNPDGGFDDPRTKPQFTGFRNAPLYFAHVQEVKESSELLNKTYIPGGYKGDNEAVNASKTVEANVCSSVNVRTNKGDHLFPGDDDEMQINDLEYTIEEVLCKVEMNNEPSCKCPNNQTTCAPSQQKCEPTYTHRCNAEVYITIHTGTKTPWADEIYDTTVAGSASTFRKIFPQVSENAPVNCIADIPTVTKVNYDRSQSEKPRGGDQSSKVIRYPEDGAGSGPELTFPHVGSIYEYFLQGIQTALRPKGYGAPIANGNCVTTETGACRQWLFEKDNQGKYYYDKIIETAMGTTCNGKSLNPFWAIGIALNENGGLMTDNVEGFSTSHFGCNMSELQSINDKISCMANTLRNDCLQGKTDEEALEEYGYLPGYVLWPITVLDPGGSYPPPLFGSGFNTSQLVTNLLGADWRATYASVASIFCPSSPTLPN